MKRSALPLFFLALLAAAALSGARAEATSPILFRRAVLNVEKKEDAASVKERMERRRAELAGSRDLTREWDVMTTQLDLSRREGDFEALLERVSDCLCLEEIELTDAEGGCAYSLEEAARIQAAAPDARVHAVFELFGKTVDSLQESLAYRDTPIGEEGLDTLRLALGLMPDCTSVTLDDCRIGNESMAALREEYEGRVKIVWRVHFSIFSCLTDTKIIHAVAAEHETTLSDEQCEVLRYCTETEYIDLGHDPLTSIEFCRTMPHLKVAILSYNNITDLSPLADCRELYCLELFSCRKLQDLTPLRGCTGLRLLNVSHSGVEDVSVVGELEGLELFHCTRTAVPPEQIEALRKQLPDCRISYEGEDMHEQGWRKVEPGKYYDWYLELREIMGYARGDYSHK